MTGTIDLVWWVSAVELPVLGGLFWLVTKYRRDTETALDSLRQRAETAQTQVRESLAAYKLEVAKAYASHEALKDVEIRLTDHLLRIEHKLECVAEGGR